MAVDFITPLIKAGVEMLTHTLAHARRTLGKKKYNQLLSTAIAELLKEHPNIDEAKARIAALETTGVAPSPDLLRAKSMLRAVVAHSRQRKRFKKGGKAKRRTPVTRPAK